MDIILSSQSHRSASTRGCPEDILAMFCGEWRSSPSMKGKCVSFAIARPIVDFPHPAGPPMINRGTSLLGDKGFSLSLFLVIVGASCIKMRGEFGNLFGKTYIYEF